jgi:hypothetical protein
LNEDVIVIIDLFFRELTQGKNSILAETIIDEIEKELDNLNGTDLLN